MDDSIVTMPEKALNTKVCITCHKELPIDEFGVRRCRSSKPDAHWIYSRYGECKECTRKRKAKWRSEHPNYMKDWYRKQKMKLKMNSVHIGVVKFFNVGRLYGFITDESTGKEYFCHNNGLTCHIKKGDRVTFELTDGLKGLEAVNVTLINNDLLKIQCDGLNSETK